VVDAVIVSTARTPIGKAYRGALNNTDGASLLGGAIKAAVARAEIDPGSIEDVVMGAAMQQGTTGGNIARKGDLRVAVEAAKLGLPEAKLGLLPAALAHYVASI
jgi:acetyl-CoA C-acetyltransferase/acetyl-CoA acyltransferase